MTNKTFRPIPPHRHLASEIIGGESISSGAPYNQFPSEYWDFEGLLQIVAEATSMTQQEIIDAIYKWITSDLGADAPSNPPTDDEVTVSTGEGSLFSVGEVVAIRDDNGYEKRTIESISGDVLTMTAPLTGTYTVAANGTVDHWEPEGFTEPDNKIRWKDKTTSNYISSFLITVSDDNDAPLIVFDQGIVFKKDLSVGGFLGANQGALMLGHGLLHTYDYPKIILTDAGFDTLRIVNSSDQYVHIGCDTIYAILLSGGSLDIDEVTIVTNGRVLQNVTTDAGIVTSGTFATTRIPNLDASKITTGTFATARIPNLDASKITSGVFSSARIPTITYGMTNFANQNLLISSDAIFNSVKGTSGSGAVKAGDEFTIAWDATYVHLTSHNKDLRITVPSGKNIELNPAVDIRIIGSKNFMPSANNECNIGGDGTGTNYYFGSGWFNYLRYKNLGSFDALPDLQLAKNYKTKTITEQGIEREVIDKDSLPFLRPEKGDFFDAGKVNGFLLGCVKQLAQEIDLLKTEIATLKGGKTSA